MISSVETLFDELSACEYDRAAIEEEESRLRDEIADLEQEMGDEAFGEALEEYYK